MEQPSRRAVRDARRATNPNYGRIRTCTCKSCGREKLVSEFRSAAVGPIPKTCIECRAAELDRIAQREAAIEAAKREWDAGAEARRAAMWARWTPSNGSNA